MPLYELISDGGYSPVRPGRTRLENLSVRYLSCFRVFTTFGCCSKGFNASLIGPGNHSKSTTVRYLVRDKMGDRNGEVKLLKCGPGCTATPIRFSYTGPHFFFMSYFHRAHFSSFGGGCDLIDISDVFVRAVRKPSVLGELLSR